MFGSDRDLVVVRLDHLPIFPLLLVGDQSSLFEDVVQEDVHDVVAGAYFSKNPLAAAYECFALIGSPVLLHQHYVSTIFFVHKGQ